ncbi:MAG TPA: aminotransferase class IV, partial [Pyrinomonadaceae bacterium]|nr:aminotransferase class IV [Pyrinomonadaceae bacterium]
SVANVFAVREGRLLTPPASDGALEGITRRSVLELAGRLGIPAAEPIANKLLFERFLSAGYERYPDIDLDLPSGDDRESVIQHVYKKYGERSAGMTANVICYRGKSAVREVGKTFGFGPEVLTRLSKLNSYYETFKGAELEARLKENGFDPTTDIRLRKFGEMYHRILTFPRHLGQHSGGMVVSLDRLDGVTPLEPASMPGRNIIQWDKDDCEALKIVKVDLLGLGMMAVLRDSIELIRTHHGEEMGLYQIPHDDPKVYETLRVADTVGMFQVESRAQIAFLPKSRPENFYDIVVQVAIIRPGPIVGNMLSSYIKRRQGLEEVDYMHPLLEPTLKRTMGVPLFQEQLLKIAMDVADFSGSEAEELRRAMGFKRPDRKLERISRNLRNGMSKNGIPEDIQEKIVNYVKAFANYGFPESHAYSFALLAYASAYFIVHYRACFMVAMFNNYPLGFYSAATLVKDAQRHGLHFIALDINRSNYDFTVEDVDGEWQVRVGLRFVRGLREEIGRKIVEERDRPSRLCRLAERRSSASPEDAPHSLAAMPPISVPRAGGIAADPFEHVTERHSFSANRAAEPHIKSIPYTSIADLIDRVPEINKREIRALSLAGALNFDNTVHRREALWESELAIQPEGSLFDGVRTLLSATGNADKSVRTPFKRMEGLQLVDADLRKTGISIGKHPLAFLREELAARGVITAHDARYLVPGQVARLAGAVIVRQRPMTAKNVVFITLEDETGHSNFVVMPDKFEDYRAVINGNDFLIIKGIFEERGMLKAIHFENLAELDTTVVSHNFR